VAHTSNTNGRLNCPTSVRTQMREVFEAWAMAEFG
jgi:hypothetical protein